jgi:hypothetical protein
VSPVATACMRGMTWLLPLLAAGCTSDEEAASASASCQEAEAHSDLSWIQDNVLTPSCAAFGACHRDAATSAAGLNLEAGRAYASLVGKPSRGSPPLLLVSPGSPSTSYLMIITGQVTGALPADVATMPLGAPLLCAPKRDAIERWILAGAQP